MLLKNIKNDIMQLKLWYSRDIANKTIKTTYWQVMQVKLQNLRERYGNELYCTSR